MPVRAGDVVYMDEYGGGTCSVKTLASWAEMEVPRPEGWSPRPSYWSEWAERRSRAVGDGPRLPPGSRAPGGSGFSRELSDLAKSIVLHAFRNTVLEDIHAGKGVPAGSVVLTPDGRRIPLEQVSHISDERMRELMIESVNKVYAMLALYPRAMLRLPDGWNEAELMTVVAYSGLFGEEERLRAIERMRARRTAGIRSAVAAGGMN